MQPPRHTAGLSRKRIFCTLRAQGTYLVAAKSICHSPRRRS